ncbi:hypothetical protein EON65_02560 [archaeon]|nr:MAG: hypothetical protein EON65_02560 [archaeon]
MCLRKHAHLLLWALSVLCAQYHIRSEVREIMILTLKESLMLDMIDEDLQTGLAALLQAGLKSDYQIKVKI